MATSEDWHIKELEINSLKAEIARLTKENEMLREQLTTPLTPAYHTVCGGTYI